MAKSKAQLTEEEFEKIRRTICLVQATHKRDECTDIAIALQYDLAEIVEQRVTQYREALHELVVLKLGPRDEEYTRRKPLAWDNAKRLIGTQ